MTILRRQPAPKTAQLSSAKVKSLSPLLILVAAAGFGACRAAELEELASPALVPSRTHPPSQTEALVTLPPTLPPTLIPKPTSTFSFGAVQLPEECTPPSFDGGPPWYEWLPCSDFAFSPDGRYVGFFFGPDNCGRGIYIQDTETGAPVFTTEFAGGGHGFEMLANGKILLRRGHCEGGGIDVLDPATGQMEDLGTEGSITWNASRTAFAVIARQYIMIETAIWGYNVSEDLIFLPQPDVVDWQLEDLPVWTPDGSHILFQHRRLNYSLDMESYSFPTARQIIRVDAASGQKTILLDDPRYDFDFCEGHQATCSPWHGDWIQVRRLPFTPHDIPFNFDFFLLPAATCLLDGVDCAESPDLFALNWRTGELIPWEESLLPTPLPTKTHDPAIPYG